MDFVGFKVDKISFYIVGPKLILDFNFEIRQKIKDLKAKTIKILQFKNYMIKKLLTLGTLS